jgi:hypothetical protein
MKLFCFDRDISLVIKHIVSAERCKTNIKPGGPEMGGTIITMCNGKEYRTPEVYSSVLSRLKFAEE